MYSYCDQHALNTPKGDRLLLWAMRTWAYSVAHDHCPLRLLLPIFCRMGLVTSTVQFHKSMSLLELGGADTAALAWPGGDQIREQEAVLLALWNQIRRGEQAAAIRTLEHLVDPEWVTESFAAMSATLREILASRADLFRVARPVRNFSVDQPSLRRH